MAREYTPIAVAYKTKYGKNVMVKQFKDLRCPDKLITKRSNLLPKDCEILEIGVGKRYFELYKKKFGKKL